VLVEPVHVPSVTVSVLPTCAVPESTGRTVAAGGAGLTFAVAAELEATAASTFVAVTTAFSVLSTSAATSLYVGAFAPAFAAQPEPSASQRCHEYAYAVSAGAVQPPRVIVSVAPATVAPVTTGALVATGGTAATTLVAALVLVPVPVVLVASTFTRSVKPTSALVAT
jgi:hypothetical protein